MVDADVIGGRGEPGGGELPGATDIAQQMRIRMFEQQMRLIEGAQREFGGTQRFAGGMGERSLEAFVALPRLLRGALGQPHRGDDRGVGLFVATSGIAERGAQALRVLDPFGEPVTPGGVGLAIDADAGDHRDQGGPEGGDEAGRASTPRGGGAGSKLV